MIGQHPRDQRRHVAFARDVASHRGRPVGRAIGGEVGDHHRARALVAESPRQAGADAAAASVTTTTLSAICNYCSLSPETLV